MTRFVELPDDVRLGFRREVDAAGGSISDYQGDGVVVSMPRGPGAERIRKAAEAIGLRSRDGWFFPLGSDKPAEILRHDSVRYGFKRCNWYREFFRPIEAA